VADVTTAVWAATTRTLTSFGTLAADVWAVSTRLLTAGTNIVLAKGVGVTGFNDLDAAGVRSAIGLASANLDTQIGTLATAASVAALPSNASIGAQITSDHGAGSYIRNTEPDNADITAIKAKTDNLPASPAAVGSAMTLTAAYDAAKTASTQTSVDAVKAKTDNLPASPADQVTLVAVGTLVSALPSANANADALLDRANGVETALTPRQALRLATAAAAGKLSGAATTTVTIRNAVADSKDRITATVDSDGNRLAVATDVS
jgi:hypothetical protein